MSIQLDVRYARLLNLELVKETQKNYFNFRCPICGDSEKFKNKKRGWLLPAKDNQGLFFHCFNCSAAMNFSYFLHKVDDQLLKRYAKDKFQEKNNFRPIKRVVEEVKKIVTLNTNIKNLLPIVESAKEYLIKRKINEKYWKDIYYTDNYKKWVVENYLPEKYAHTDKKDERIVFPLHTSKGELIGFQGRSLDPNNTIRYLTIKIVDTEHPLCFGLDKINVMKSNIFFAEGIFDSLMVDNSVAMLKSNMNLKFIKENFNPSQVIFVFDNEPRNKDIVKNYNSIASIEDFGLFIWPKNVEVKDLNELAVKQNWDINRITSFITNNSVFGRLKKTIQLTNWRI